MDRRVFMAILLAFAVVGMVFLTVTIFRPFLLAILWGGVLVTVSQRAHETVLKGVRGRRTLAAAVMTLIMTLVILGPILLIGLVTVQEAVELQRTDLGSKLQDLDKVPLVQRGLKRVRQITGSKAQTLNELVKSLKQTIVPAAVRLGRDIVTFLFGFLLDLFFIILALFYFYRDGPKAVRVLRELIPLPPEDRESILSDIQSAIIASVRGGLVTAVVQGFLGYVIYVILGIDKAVLAAVITALASLVPFVGTALAWGAIAIWFALQGDFTHAFVLVAYGFLVIGMADNFVRPILVGQHMRAHPLLLFFGILGGVAVFGFAGLILGPVVVAFLTVSARLLRREFRAAAEGA